METGKHTDIETTKLNRPWGKFNEKYGNVLGAKSKANKKNSEL